MLEQKSQLRREIYFYNLLNYFITSSRDQEEKLIS